MPFLSRYAGLAAAPAWSIGTTFVAHKVIHQYGPFVCKVFNNRNNTVLRLSAMIAATKAPIYSAISQWYNLCIGEKDGGTSEKGKSEPHCCHSRPYPRPAQ